jgi:anti-sigma regulatory factor (Ser/Thr protein kinase)
VPQPSAELLRENGLGVFLMRNLMDRVTFTREDGTTVRLEKRLPESEGEKPEWSDRAIPAYTEPV